MFAKWPEPGAVKTRLAAVIGDEAAADLARAFLVDLCTTAEALEYDLTVAYSPPHSREGFRSLLSSRWELWEQQGDDLGARLAAALERSAGVDTLVIGSDSPWLSADDLAAAFKALARADAVVGPCADGGFYLLGVNAGVAARMPSPAAWLEGVRWSTTHALEDLLAAFDRLGFDHRLLPSGYDVDTVDDLPRLAADLNRRSPGALPAVRESLSRVIQADGVVRGGVNRNRPGTKHSGR